MQDQLASYARSGPHLDLLGQVEIGAVGQFVIHRGHAFVSAKYNSDNSLKIVDLQDPRAPKLRHKIQFKRSITSVALRGDLLYAAESYRALNVIDVADPAAPDYFDCGVALGSSLYDVKIVGGYAALGLNFAGLGLMDIGGDSPSRRLRWSDRKKTDEGFVEHLVVVESRIFAAAASGGLLVFEIHDGKLEEIARPCGEGFNASKVHLVDGEVWVEGTPDDGDRQLVVIDPKAPDQLKASHALESTPQFLLPLGDGRALGSHDGYTWAAYAPHDGWDGDLFEQFTNDDNGAYLEVPSDQSELSDDERERLGEASTSCFDDVIYAVKAGDFLYAAAGQSLVVFDLPKGSVFRRCA